MGKLKILVLQHPKTETCKNLDDLQARLPLSVVSAPEEAFHYLKDQQFDLVLLPVTSRQEEESARQFSTELKHKYPHIPIVLASGEGYTFNQAECKDVHLQTIPLDQLDPGSLEQIIKPRDPTTPKPASHILPESILTASNSLLDLLPDLVDRITPDGTILYANPAYCRFFGKTCEQLIGEHITSFVPREERQKVIQKIKKLTPENPVTTDTISIHRPDGEIAHIEWTEIGIFDEKGKLSQVIGIGHDVTSLVETRNTLAHSEAFVRSVIDHAPVGILHLDANLYITYENDAMKLMMGLTKDSPSPVEGLAINQLPGLDTIDLDAIIKEIKAGHTISGLSFRYKALTGVVRDLQVHAAPILGPDGTFAGAILMAVDVTEQNKAQSEVEQQLKEFQVLHAVATACTRVQDEYKLIEEVTKILYQTLYPDNLGVLLWDEQNKVLYPHPTYHGIPDESGKFRLELGQGVCGSVAASLQSALIEDCEKDPRYFNAGTGVMGSEVAVPLHIGDTLIGVLNAESKQKNFFTTQDERLLSTLAGTLASAIQRLRTEAEEHNQRTLAEALHQAASLLNSTLEPEEVLDHILDAVGRVVKYETATIFRIENEQAFTVRHRGFDKYHLENWVDNLRMPLKPGTIIGDAVRNRRPEVVPVTNEDPRWVEFPELQWMKSALVLPLKSGDDIFGLLTLDSSQPGYFTAETAERLQAFADQVAISMRNAELYSLARTNAEQQVTLYKVTQDIISAGNDLEAVYEALHHAARRLMTCEAFVITILDEKHQQIHLAYGYDKAKRAAPISVPYGEGLTSIVTAQRKTLYIPDTESNPLGEKIHHFGDPEHTRSILATPLSIEKKILGMLSVQSYSPNAYTEKEIQLLEMLAAIAAPALDNARLYHNALQSSLRYAVLHRVSQQMVAASLTPEKIYQAIHEAVQKLMPSDVFVISLATENPEQVFVAYIYDNGELHPPQYAPTEGSISGQIIRSGKPINITNVSSDVGIKVGGGEDVVSILAVPLKVEERIIGMISTQSFQPHAYDENDLRLLEMFASHAAVALENARLLENVQKHSATLEIQNRITTEALTGEQLVDTLNVIAKELTHLFDADGCHIALWDEEKQLPVPTAAYGDQAETFLAFEPKPDEHSMTARIVREGEILAVKDTQATSHVSPRIKDAFSTIKSALGIPLKMEEKVIGAAILQYKQKHAFTAEEIALGKHTASQVSLAISKVRLIEETQTRARQFEALYQTANQIIGEQDLETILQKIVDQATTLLKTEYGGIFLYDPASKSFKLEVTKGFDQLIGTVLQEDEGIAGKILKSRKPIYIENYHQWEGRGKAFNGIPFTSTLEAPMIYQNKLYGTILVTEVAPKQHTFTDEDIHLLELFASQAAIAVHSANLFTQLNQRLTELQAISDVSAAMRTAPTRADIPPVILHHISNLLNLDTAALLIWDEYIGDAVIEDIVGEGSLQKGKRFPLEHPLIQQLRSSSQPQELKNQETRIQDLLSLPAIGQYSSMAVPLYTQENNLGAMLVLRRRKETDGNGFTELETRLLRAVSDITANALQRAELHMQTQEHLRRLTVLHEIEMAVGASFDLDLTFDILLDRIVNHLDIDAADIYLFEPPLQRLKWAGGYGFSRRETPQIYLRLGEGLAGKAAYQRRVIALTDINHAPEYIQLRGLENEKFKTYYAIPMIIKGELQGVLEIFYRRIIHATQTWEDFLLTLAAQAALAIDNANLFNRARRSSVELELAYDATIQGWSDALELRDMETEGHARRVTEATVRLAREMGIPQQELVHIRRGALLHDIGKMAIPDSILRKPGKLNEEEWILMRKHPTYAHDLLSKIDYLRPALDIPYYHHEKWDGTGYPLGLKGEEIPLPARIFAIIDVWDALLSNRPYRPAWPEEEVIEYIRQQSGKHFDPEVVRAFLSLYQRGVLRHSPDS